MPVAPPPWTGPEGLRNINRSPDNPFAIELSDFTFVTRNIRTGKALRLTVTWKFIHPEYGLLGMSTEGCMVMRRAGGFRFSPPVSHFGPLQSKQLQAITTDFHDLIIRMLRNTKTKNGTCYLDYVGSEVPESIREKAPAEVDAELPREIGGEEEKE